MNIEQLERRALLAVDLTYSSYLGGDGVDNPFLFEVLDTGEVFIAGSTTSTNFTTTAGGDDSFGGGFVDVFVAKLAKSGKMLWSTYLGGNGIDLPTSIDSDAQGRLIVGGTSQSSDFEATAGKDESLGGTQDAFLTRLDPSNGSVIWSTLVGGDEAEANPNAMVSPTGQWFISGNTNSEDFPAGGGFDSSFGGGTGDDFSAQSEGYVGLLNPNTGAMTKISFIGGNGNDTMLARTFDTSGNFYLSFTTTSGNIPVRGGGFDSPNAGGQDAYVIKISPTGTRLWSSVVGGSGNESTAGLTLDALDRPLLFSTTASDDFPTSAGQDGSFGGETDAALFAFNANGGRRYATYIGGNGADTTIAIQVDQANNAPLAMVKVESTNLTAAGGFDNKNPDGNDHLLTRFSASGGRKEWSTFLGGAGTTEVAFFRPNPDGSVFALGTTEDEDFTANGGFQTEIGGQVDAFVIKISKNGTREWSTFIGGESDEGFATIGFTDTSLSLMMFLPTNSDDFQTKGGFQNSYGGGGDVLALRLTPAGKLETASYFGGESAESMNVFRHPNGDVLGVGTTQSDDYPTSSNARDKSHNGQHDVAIAKLSFGKAGKQFFAISNGKLTITGSGDDDTIVVRRDGDQLELTSGDQTEQVDLDEVDSIEINTGAGADTITINSNVELGVTITTGKGGDTVRGGAGDDSIEGGSGKDDLQGRAGDDSINGQGGDDIIEGGDGRDRLTGGDGEDQLAGGAGADRFTNNDDDEKDILLGQKGTDRADEEETDPIDELTGIETT